MAAKKAELPAVEFAWLRNCVISVSPTAKEYCVQFCNSRGPQKVINYPSLEAAQPHIEAWLSRMKTPTKAK